MCAQTLCKRRFALVAILFLALVFYLITFTDQKLFLVKLNQVDFAVRERLLIWNWQDTEEEVYCRSNHELLDKAPIPNVVHFIMLAGEGNDAEITFAQFLAVKSALVRVQPEQVKIHTYGMNKENLWWKQLQNNVTLVMWDRDELILPPHISIDELAIPHEADFMRLQILAEQGGIYLDTDVYALKPFTELLNNPRDTVMGHEGGNRYGLCNAVIVSRPKSEFISKWRETYQTFDDRSWNYHSVLVPKRLQVEYSEQNLVCPLSPTAFFWPTWYFRHVRYMHMPMRNAAEKTQFESDIHSLGGVMYENQLAFHSWNAHSYLSELTPEKIQTEDTRFNVLMRDISAGPL